MRHLDDEQVIAAVRAARTGDATPGAGTAAHLAACAHCRDRVAEARALRDAVAAVEAEDVPEAPDLHAAVPAFDALVLPALRGETAPAPDPVPVAVPTAAASWRITVALVLRQARLVPGALWPLTGLGFAALLLLAWNLGPAAEPVLLGPGITLLVTMGALAVCEPRRDPRREVFHAMPVPPVAVWLARLALVVGADLVAATVLTVVVGWLPGGDAGVVRLVALWFGPALLTAALAAFGSVWHSPTVGAVLGGCGWLAGVAATAGDLLPVPGGLLRVAATVWTTNVGTLAAALLLIGAAAFLVTRPRSGLLGGAA
ncbi:hypothetical protein [Nocardiopsis halotolerans]|uniref:hypothetical protein n=1 Tax=Nocardiopsis halotolerans TaxID=124252 RepID=UPI00034CE2B7|nr:hypothetical protein [Nocardiopsis halotolerans]